jgi:hypothetical protein
VRGERKSSRVKKASESAFVVWRREKRGERDEESRLGYE